jgi:hypothetical protein
MIGAGQREDVQGCQYGGNATGLAEESGTAVIIIYKTIHPKLTPN